MFLFKLQQLDTIFCHRALITVDSSDEIGLPARFYYELYTIQYNKLYESNGNVTDFQRMKVYEHSIFELSLGLLVNEHLIHYTEDFNSVNLST